MKPMVTFTFDVSPDVFGEGAVLDLVGQEVKYEGEDAFVEHAHQTGPSRATLVLKPVRRFGKVTVDGSL